MQPNAIERGPDLAFPKMLLDYLASIASLGGSSGEDDRRIVADSFLHPDRA